jgi:type IV pilus assembly protein PilW
MRAQYGISTTVAESAITSWVDPVGDWLYVAGVTPTMANRNLVKAIRVVIVARNGVLEKTAAETGTTACSSLTDPNPTGLCAWEGSLANPAPTIDLSNDPDWQRYRYRVFETIIPIRNFIWNRGTL